MGNSVSADHGFALRLLPSVDELLSIGPVSRLGAEIGQRRATRLARASIESLRKEVKEATAANQPVSPSELSKEALLTEAARRVGDLWRIENLSRLHRVINATGVVVHTNLGRAPLSEKAIEAIVDEAAGYTTLEYDIQSGKRGRRGAQAEALAAELTGAESAVVVNNCAAAALLVLIALARGGEVIVSRGELVEIGGDFRVPDVLAQSGAVLREVGTTNRTKTRDYEQAINERTALILRVHPSNYKIIGFTDTPPLEELAALANRHELPLYEDAGSGALVDLSRIGLADEPVIPESIHKGVDVVTFSGDKLLGGPQCGIVVGSKELVDRVRKHPLYRALRVDKLTYAALAATLESYLQGDECTEVPVQKMLHISLNELRSRTQQFAETLIEPGGNGRLKVEMIDGNSAVGGGAAPGVQPATSLIALTHREMSAAEVERCLRVGTPPIITRIADDRVLIDLRTVRPDEEPEIAAALTALG